MKPADEGNENRPDRLREFPLNVGDRPGLYVHVPFCSSICPYCDFAVSKDEPSAHALFVDSLRREIAGWNCSGTFDSVYFGGGTPSCLPSEHLAAVLAALRGRFQFAPDTVITLEANPEHLSNERLVEWRSLGVDRLSLGVQALDDDVLRRLGRRHRRRDALRAIERSVAAGMSSVSADFIYSAPGLSLGTWRQCLGEAAGLGLDHMSCYELTVHEGTPFSRLRERGGLPQLPEDEQAAWFLNTHQWLEELGLPGYEVCNFATDSESQSRHNWKYWRHEPYLGLGPAAHSWAGGERFWNLPSWRQWSGQLQAGETPCAGREHVGKREWLLEALMLSLRTRSGFDLERLAGRGPTSDHVDSWAAEAILEFGASLLFLDGRWLRPTLAGLAVADRLAVDLCSSLERRMP